MLELLALLKQYRNSMVAVLMLTVALVLLLSLRFYEPGQHKLISDRMLDIVGPLQKVVLSPLVAYRHVQTRISELKQLDYDNQHMKAELRHLRHLGSQLEELKQENARLMKLLNIPYRPDFQRISARVIGDSSSVFARSLLINVGKAEGVFPNAIVIVPEGLLGRVVRVGSHTSLVLTLLDLNSRVPVLVQRTRDRGLATGFNGRKLHLEFISKEAEIKVDDLIVTSGTGEGFPKGLVVGRVEKLSTGGNGLFRQLTVMPVVDFDHVEDVAILMVPSRENDIEAIEWDYSTAEEP
ncbi:MAG: rod shape-determining protein MreC [Magnetococcales bacterium]|nr:rod shape-determining protein MreC [Magnetococcales bacterium]